MADERFIEKLGVDRSKFNINGKDFYMFEMTIKRQKLLIEKIQEMAFQFFNDIKDTEVPVAMVEGDIAGVASDVGSTKVANTAITSALNKLPIAKLTEIFNFTCFPVMCNGCSGYRKSECSSCTKVKAEQVTSDWFENSLTNREIKEIAMEIIRINQLEKLIEFFFRASR